MKKIILQRITGNDECTTGALVYNWRAFCLTLEDAWRGNKTGISCIPPGHYVCKRGPSPKRGYDVWWVQDVYGRADIQIHKGNTDMDTEGCILVGERFEPIKDKQAVLQSADAWWELNQILKDDNEFELEVRHFVP